MRWIKKLFALFAGLAIVVSLSACSLQAIDMKKITAVIDVRTAAEYQAGHLQGAVNVDVESPDFASNIGAFDKAGSYVLYCHSGRRAGIAKDTMTSMGFSTLINAGAIGDASSATGLPIVQ